MEKTLTLKDLLADEAVDLGALSDQSAPSMGEDDLEAALADISDRLNALRARKVRFNA